MIASPSHTHCADCGLAVVYDPARASFYEEGGVEHRRCETLDEFGFECGAWVGVLPNGKRVDYLTGKPHACGFFQRSREPHNVYALAGLMADERRARR